MNNLQNVCLANLLSTISISKSGSYLKMNVMRKLREDFELETPFFLTFPNFICNG